MKLLRGVAGRISSLKFVPNLSDGLKGVGTVLITGVGVGLTSYQLYTFKTQSTQKIKCESIAVPNEPGKLVDSDGNKGSDMRKKMTNFVLELQKEICDELSIVDGTQFLTDKFIRPNNGGYSISRVLEGGKVLGRGGVNVSIVEGKLPPQAVQQMRSEVGDQFKNNKLYPFFTASISLVLHPQNPFAPTVHLNYRYFEVEGDFGSVWWFGGGSDLTPAYLIEEDAVHFHSTLKRSLDKFSPTYYPKFKTWCDRYFYNSHRKECRGVGGIFFDDVDSSYAARDQLFEMVRSCGKAFLPSYLPILEKRKDTQFTQAQLEWQQLRRGRYVEFNLLHDRGTKFGLLAPNPKVESILVSLPPISRWAYQVQPQPNSPEQKLVEVLQNPKDWVY